MNGPQEGGAPAAGIATTANGHGSVNGNGRGPRPDADLGRLARGGALNLVGAALSAVLGVVFVVAVTHVFSPADMGVYFAVTSVFLVLATVGRLGAPTGVVYFIARLRTLGQSRLLGDCLRVALRPVVLVSIAIGLLVAVFAPQLAARVIPENPQSAVMPLRLLGGFIPLAVLSDVSLAATRGFGILRALVVVDKIGRPLGQLCLLGLVIFVGWRGPTVLTAVWVLPYLPAAVVAFIWVTRARKDAERMVEANADAGRPLTTGMAGEFWRFTAPRSLSSLAQVVLQRLDIILLAALRGPVEAAIYGAVTRVLVVGQLGSQAISITVQPNLSALLAHRAISEVGRVYQASTGWLVLVTWPVYLLFSVFSQEVPRIFGEGYEAGASVVLILCLTMLFATGAGMVDVVLSMAGRTSWVLGNTLVALTLNVILNLLLIPRYGISGAAVAWAVAILANNVLPLLQVRLALGLHPYGRGALLAMGLSVSCFGLIPLVSQFALGETLWALLVSAACGALAFLGGLWLLRRPLALDDLRSLRRGRR